MAALVRASGAVKRLISAPKLSAFGVLPARTYWNKDWQPGPYPRTPEDRAAAAKKYGLLPEDYEPFPSEHDQHGDYPNLADIGGDSKDPYYPYDYPAIKTNYGEPIHIEADIYGEDRYNPSGRPHMPYWKMYVIFSSVMFGFFILFALGDMATHPRKVMPKQLPAQGEKHYTFEPADS